MDWHNPFGKRLSKGKGEKPSCWKSPVGLVQPRKAKALWSRSDSNNATPNSISSLGVPSSFSYYKEKGPIAI